METQKKNDYYDSEHHEELRQRYNELLKEYTKYCLNSIYGSGPCPNCVVQDENERLRAENESLKAELQKLEKKVETYAFDIEWSHDMKLQEALSKQRDDMEREYEARNKRLWAENQKLRMQFKLDNSRLNTYSRELASTKAVLAEANCLIKKLLHEQLQCAMWATFAERREEDECKAEVQEAKEENRAARESKDTD